MHPRSEKVYKKAYASAEMYGVRMKALPDPVYNFGQDGLCDILGVQFRILHIPGHSPGSIGFYLAEVRSGLVMYYFRAALGGQIYLEVTLKH
jgi:glyoxylase-like metal-dependent hydrolase (beta-lactamase superfamily II)